ncbi:PLDc_N domain-containing protein [Arthrobacter echini]|uniref:PLDc_N domain-containing protein n=1 Tax=Arthrobacter echini TaxID=1529066 RepID=A0A4S5EA08_9MICC|nr:PLDc_N domain-containing protein [Arthrobacter echini]
MLAWATQGANPLVPTSWEFLVTGIGLLLALLLVAAFIDIARSRHLTGLTQAVWVLVVLAFPAIGPLLWFVIGRRTTAVTRDSRSGPTSSAGYQ